MAEKNPVKEPKTFYFDLPRDAGINLKHVIYSIIKHYQLLTEHTIKMRLYHDYPNISMETIFMNTENSKTNERHKLVFKLSQRLDLRSMNNMLFFKAFLFITPGTIQDN